MNELKNKILGKIFEKYNQWTQNEVYHCFKGCSLCCTQNVMVTAIEGQYIYNYILRNKMEAWFAGKLAKERQTQTISLTTNGFARKCIEKNEECLDEKQTQLNEICPFLEEYCCKIYAVRPFACRSFASTKDCRESGAACLSERLLVINTVTMQFIEHLGQKEYWGNMLDVLLSLAGNKANFEVKKYISDDKRIKRAISKTLIAEPLPGFLLKPEEENEVNQYLQSILTENIGMKTIKEIFNNK
jgi:Fe-S-cluster containining protein